MSARSKVLLRLFAGAFYFEPMSRKHEKTSSGFEHNAFYERLIEIRGKGKIDMTLLSIPTRLALAEYEKQKCLRDALAEDFKDAALVGQVAGHAER